MKPVVDKYDFMDEEDERLKTPRDKDKCYDWLLRQVCKHFAKRTDEFIDGQMINYYDKLGN